MFINEGLCPHFFYPVWVADDQALGVLKVYILMGKLSAF